MSASGQLRLLRSPQRMLIAVLVGVLVSGAAADSSPVLEQRFGSSHLLVASEGRGEPRSTGSYTLHLYRIDNPDYPRDHFLSGLVRPRDGILESILLSDLDQDGTDELLVLQRSAGSGSYLSVDGFWIKPPGLRFIASVRGLPPARDPVAELRKKLPPASIIRAADQPTRHGDLWI